jgi:hypothetical protein
MYTSKESTERAVASWHPIHTTTNKNLWELPHASRSFDVNANDHWHPIHTTANKNLWELPHASRTFDVNANDHENQSLTYSWSNRDNTNHNEDSDSNSRRKKRRVLGDATNTAPVLNVNVRRRTNTGGIENR